MIPAMRPDVQCLISPETAEEIAHTLSTGRATCTVCETAIRPELEDQPSVLALQAPDGRTLIRFAHQQCAESRLIHLAQMPPPTLESAPDQVPHARESELAWALSARPRVVPTVILTCDVDEFETLDVRGRALLDALRLDGLQGGGPLEQLKPARQGAISVHRDQATLCLTTPYGVERLGLGDLGRTLPLLHVAARQHELLLMLGEQLAIGAGNLERADRSVRDNEAIAARVAYTDPELASQPLRGRRRGSLDRWLPRRRAASRGPRR